MLPVPAIEFFVLIFGGIGGIFLSTAVADHAEGNRSGAAASFIMAFAFAVVALSAIIGTNP